MRLLKIAFLSVLFQVALGQQAPSATVSGIVVKQVTGEPLSKVTIEIYPDGAVRRVFTATTAEDGKFSVSGVEPGQYRISATRNGYVRAEYGDRSSNGCGTPVSLAPGQRLADARISMMPAGVISGHLYDADREGMPNVSAHALKYVYQNGKRVLTVVQTVQTNDLGEYRLFGLTPGRYYVAAALENSAAVDRIAVNRIQDTVTLPPNPTATPGALQPPRIVAVDIPADLQAKGDRFLPTYYPGVADPAQAQAIELRPGESTARLDMTVTFSHTAKIRGKVVVSSLTLNELRAVQLVLLPRFEHPYADSPVGRGRVLADGSFEILSVLPGSYSLVAFAVGGRLVGRTTVDVGEGDLQNVVINLAPGFEITGRVTADDPKVMGQVVGVNLMPSGYSPNAAGPLSSPTVFPAELNRSDGSFKFQGIAPGDYLPMITFTTNGGIVDIYVKTLRLGSQDVRDGIHVDSQAAGLLEIVVGNNGAAVEGTVVNDKQSPMAGATVVLVPDIFLRKRGSLYKTRTSDAAGHFRFDAIAPGDYKVFAWQDVENGAWQDADFIRTYETRGKAVTLREGTTEAVQISVIPSTGSIYGQCAEPFRGPR